MRGSILISGLLLSAVSAVAACGGSSDSGTTPAADAGAADVTPIVIPDDASIEDAGQATVDAAKDAGPPVDNGAPSDTYPAAHPTAPELVTSGGPTMKAPVLVPVFFANEQYAKELQSFTDTIGASDFYKANVAEYGVGAATGAPAIQLSETPAASITDDEIQAWLTTKLTAKAAGFETPSADTIYILYYPAATTITLQGSTSCQEFGGYHSNLSFNGKDQAYAVIPRCGDFGPLKGIDAVTGPTSHEILEGITDPFPQTNPAYSTVDDDHGFWQFLLGGAEDGDLCAQFPSSFYKPAGLDFTVQRSWSNKLAAAGHDPCAPQLAGEVYFNSAVALPESVTVGGQFQTKGVKIAVGASKTVEVDLFSDAKTSGPWTVSAMDDQQLQGQPAALTFAWDRTSGVNGEKLHLTITVKKASQYKAEGFFVVSKLNGEQHMWLGFVTN